MTTPHPALPDTKRTASWLGRVAEIENFRNRNGRLPMHQKRSVEERDLYGWLGAQIRRTRMSTAARQILDARLPGWDVRGHAGGARPFRQGVHDLKLYRDAYGKFPSSRAKDPGVLSLAQWLNTLRHQKVLTGEQRAHLDEQVPGWNETVEETWQRTAREVAVYRDRHGDMPSLSSREYPVRRLAKWLADFRRGRGMTPERETFLDTELPGWRDGSPNRKPIEIWEQKLDTVIRFQEAYGRLPRVGVRDREEARAGLWLDRQREDELLTEHRRRLLTSHLPGWDAVPTSAQRQVVRLQSFEEKWNERLVEIAGFVASNSRLPRSVHSSSERVLYAWLLKQRQCGQPVRGPPAPPGRQHPRLARQGPGKNGAGRGVGRVRRVWT
jgi:hypothetical protein